MESHIVITAEELKNPAIDDIINLEKSLGSRPGAEDLVEVETPFYLNPIFYYSVSALIGALLVWAITEPFYSDNDVTDTIPFISDYLLFGPVAAMIGFFIGVSYGLSNRNFKMMLYCGFIGLGVGMVATILTTIVADIVYGIMLNIAGAVAVSNGDTNEAYPRGLAFFIQICGRGLGWSIVSMGSGLGLGVALKSKKLIFNGLVGGMIGGLIGGFLFDPLNRMLLSYTTEAALSRSIGICCVGILVGFFIGLIENLSKESWFIMQKGPLMGKQFILFKNLTIIGSSPKSDIYLFKDPDIDPRHAVVNHSANKNIIQDENSRGGIFINGKKAKTAVLQNGDVITIGGTILKYLEKTK